MVTGGDDKTLVADNVDGGLAAVDRCLYIFRKLLDEVKIEVSAGNTSKLAADGDGHRHGREVNIFTLNDIGQWIQDALPGSTLRAKIPSTFHDAVRVQVCTVIFDQRLDSQFSIGAPCPVGQETPGGIRTNILLVAKELVLPIERIGLPSAICSVEAWIVLQDVEEDGIELGAAFANRCCGFIVVRRRYLEHPGHVARRIEGHVERRLDQRGLCKSQCLEMVLGAVFR